MKTSILLFCVVVTFTIITPVFASTESLVNPKKNSPLISELLKNYHDWDQQSINFIGEVIGQPLLVKDFVCIHLLDHEGNAIGVWMEKKFLTEISLFGMYRVKGDTVSVNGIFNLLCPMHSGDTDIHAKQITVIKEGELVSSEKPIWLLFILGWVMLLYPACLIFNNLIKKYKLHKQSVR